MALDINQIEQDFDELEARYRKKHLIRQANDTASPLINALYPNVLQDLERIRDHANNIAEQALKGN
ncbi:PhoU domain-containing protein [Mariprofundus aestuarium]|uniref:PhoU domain-containing protein n=1 Tax=Mariprofundus aestuarium TaxID=1921086 RepID=UPI0012FDA912